MTIDELKLYIKVDNTEEDNLISAFRTAAIDYIQQATGKTYAENSEVWNLAIKLLVRHWYENRVAEVPGSLSKVSYSVDSLINHIALCGDYQ
ncbi:MAG TPA: head-tail connector protein [Bacillota bacterium]|nr:head-tail connector protein [Bacillota bacterium]